MAWSDGGCPNRFLVTVRPFWAVWRKVEKVEVRCARYTGHHGWCWDAARERLIHPNRAGAEEGFHKGLRTDWNRDPSNEAGA